MTLIESMTDPETSVAVVGATDSPGKYGGRIYRDLKRKGFTVFAVNPNASTVDGDPAYPDLAALPSTPTIVNYVVPPPVTLRMLREANELGLSRAWVQPGAGDREVVDYLELNGFDHLSDGTCIMVESRSLR